MYCTNTLLYSVSYKQICIFFHVSIYKRINLSYKHLLQIYCMCLLNKIHSKLTKTQRKQLKFNFEMILFHERIKIQSHGRVFQLHSLYNIYLYKNILKKIII